MTIPIESFRFLKEWAKKRSGILLEGKEIMVESRLETLSALSKLGGIEKLVESLKENPDSPLAIKTLEALTTNETFWFRDLHPYEILKSKILPEILETRKAIKYLRIWSAACSTGQEPYSIAMILKQHFPQMDGWNVQILATDLSEQMIAKAASGRFDQMEINRGLPAALLTKYFERDGQGYRIQDAIRKKIEFRTLNLTQAFTLPVDLDVIFIRNVLIYFDAPTKKAILQRAIQNLRPGGYLFLGSAESLFGMDLPLESVMGEKTIYYRKRSHV